MIYKLLHLNTSLGTRISNSLELSRLKTCVSTGPISG